MQSCSKIEPSPKLKVKADATQGDLLWWSLEIELCGSQAVKN